VIYVKNSSEIEDFCALAGLNNAAFAVMNAKIEGEIRNNVNRVANCETNNIEKAVLASQKHINVILELERLNLLSSLPEELEQTARMRVLYRDLSLAQLAQKMVPPVSKPGLSHRLNRIIQLAEQLINAKK
jgi:DNA-binding protein WhiA